MSQQFMRLANPATSCAHCVEKNLLNCDVTQIALGPCSNCQNTINNDNSQHECVRDVGDARYRPHRVTDSATQTPRLQLQRQADQDRANRQRIQKLEDRESANRKRFYKLADEELANRQRIQELEDQDCTNRHELWKLRIVNDLIGQAIRDAPQRSDDPCRQAMHVGAVAQGAHKEMNKIEVEESAGFNGPPRQPAAQSISRPAPRSYDQPSIMQSDQSYHSRVPESNFGMLNSQYYGPPSAPQGNYGPQARAYGPVAGQRRARDDEQFIDDDAQPPAPKRKKTGPQAIVRHTIPAARQTNTQLRGATHGRSTRRGGRQDGQDGSNKRCD